MDEAIEVVVDAVADLQDHGLTPPEAIAVIAATLDALVDLRLVLPPPIGEVAEAIDGPAAEYLLGLLAALRPEPGSLRARAAVLDALADADEADGREIRSGHRRLRADRKRARADRIELRRG